MENKEKGTQSFSFSPVTLTGRYVRLEPLSFAHLPELTAAGADPAIWQWLSVTGATPAAMRVFVQDALEAQAKGSAVPFTVFEQASGKVIGSTRFGAIERAHRRAEIGWTWLNPRVQRTPVNTEQKYLMLRLAFEQWGLMRVEFKTHILNEKSRRAIARIGATQEGILRQHMIGHDGRIRDTVYFSILDREWPAVKQGLEKKLEETPRSARGDNDCHPEERSDEGSTNRSLATLGMIERLGTTS